MTFIIAHRGGAASFYPENTIPAFKKAIQMKADMVELDVHKTKDNKIVVMHDEKVDRTTNGKGFVKDITLKDIKKLNSKGYKIPTLEEVIKLTRGKIKAVIEIKDYEMEKDVVNLVKKNKVEDSVIIASFKKDIIKDIKKLDSKIKTGFITFLSVNAISTALKVKADAIICNYKFLFKKVIDNAHKNNLEVIAWTVDDKKIAENLIKKGVDGIATNRLELFR